MKIIKYILVLILSSIAMTAACSEDRHQKYIGKYEYPSSWDGSPKIVEILEDGGTFLLRESDETPMPLESKRQRISVVEK